MGCPGGQEGILKGSQIALETLNGILQSESVEALWDFLLEVMDGFGFDRLLYASTHFGTDSGWGNKADWLLLTNHHREIVNRFIGQDLYRQTAKVHHPPDGVPGAYSWRRTRARNSDAALTEAEQLHLALTRKHGVLNGYTIWFPTNNSRSKNVLGLCARPGLSQDDVDGLWQERGEEIQTLAKVAHLKLLNLPHPGLSKRLTSRQTEVLEWVADGKTGRDIADIMDLSQVTVEKHLRHTREALNVGTTAEAVKKATIMNHLFLIRKRGQNGR